MPNRILLCAFASLLTFIGNAPRTHAAPGERTVTGVMQEVSVSKRGGQMVIYLRVSGVGRKLWCPENHGDNLNTIHRGDRYRVSYKGGTGEITNRVTL